ncbi:MAG: glycine/sarcosine/betaine reductase selenoprotein B family protein [bacterium]|nr:glycine/sarcosine/betaine reductase selenoprotein B family protein [bacterium]
MSDWKFKEFARDSINADRFRRWEEMIAKTHHESKCIPNPVATLAPMKKTLAESRIAILTTGGVHLRNQTPFDVHSKEGDWGFREIPADAREKDLIITHSHYDHTEADKDINCIFPLDRLREMAAEGDIGGLAPLHIGMMGFVPNPVPLIERTGPAIARRLQEAGTDAVLLTPG